MLIRKIASRDIKGMLYLCQLHAEYENLEFHLSDQEERLKNDFITHKIFGYVAEQSDKLVAYLTYMYQYATWEAREYVYMDCLFVQEGYRNQGIGPSLISQMINDARQYDCQLIQWHTPIFNTNAIRFYHRQGAHSKTKERFFLNI